MRIDRGERVVEHQDQRVASERARQSRALLLAPGEVDASLTQHRAVTLGKALDLLGELSNAGSRRDDVARPTGLREQRFI